MILSGLVGFNRNLLTNYQIDEQAGQFAEFNASATTVQAIISKKTIYFSRLMRVLEWNIVRSNFVLNGIYDLGNGETTRPNPIDFAFDGSGGPRFTVGARVKNSLGIGFKC